LEISTMTAAKLINIFCLSAELSIAQVNLQIAGAIDTTVTQTIEVATIVARYADRIHTVLTSETARQHYRMIVRAVDIAWAIAVLVFLMVQREVDRVVADCEQSPLMLPAAIDDQVATEPAIAAEAKSEPIVLAMEAAIAAKAARVSAMLNP
jgi:hypothetical protein